jgi:hypothetical protein
MVKSSHWAQPIYKLENFSISMQYAQARSEAGRRGYSTQNSQMISEMNEVRGYA